MYRRSWSWWVRILVPVVVFALAGCDDDDDSGKLGSGYDFGDNDPNKISAMGNSITAGGWPGILAGMSGKSVVNRGVGGATSGAGAGRVNGTLASDKPGFLLIQYGANDAIHGSDPETVANNLRAIVQAAKANKTIPIVATVAPMYGDHGIFAGRARTISAAIRSMAGQEGAHVADIEAAFGTDQSLIGSDGLHPSDAGRQEIAAVFNDVLN